MAGVLLEVIQTVAVVEGQFLPGLYFPERDDPNPTLLQQRFAVGAATVVQPPRRIPAQVPVEIVDLVEFEDVGIAQITLDGGFGFGNLSAKIFEDPRSGWNAAQSGGACAVDGGFAKNDLSWRV